MVYVFMYEKGMEKNKKGGGSIGHHIVAMAAFRNGELFAVCKESIKAIKIIFF